MGHVQPFVAIVLGDGSQPDAEELARAAGAVAILRPGQPHPVPLHAPDAVIDLAAPEHDGGREDAVLDLSPVDDPADEVIDLIAPGHSAQPNPDLMPQTAVVIDPAEVLDVMALVNAVHVVLDGLKQFEVTSPGGCVVASRMVTDTLKLVDDAGVVLGTTNRDDHRWVSAPLAGPLDVLAAVAAQQADQQAAQQAGQPVQEHVASEDGSASLRPWLEALIQQGIEVQAVSI